MIRLLALPLLLTRAKITFEFLYHPEGLDEGQPGLAVYRPARNARYYMTNIDVDEWPLGLRTGYGKFAWTLDATTKRIRGNPTEHTLNLQAKETPYRFEPISSHGVGDYQLT